MRVCMHVVCVYTCVCSCVHICDCVRLIVGGGGGRAVGLSVTLSSKQMKLTDDSAMVKVYVRQA